MAGTVAHPTVADLERELAALEQRLRDGEFRIDEARLVGADVAAWEEFWIELLHTYEAVHDRLQSVLHNGNRLAA
jgi:hypothetical protein